MLINLTCAKLDQTKEQKLLNLNRRQFVQISWLRFCTRRFRLVDFRGTARLRHGNLLFERHHIVEIARRVGCFRLWLFRDGRIETLCTLIVSLTPGFLSGRRQWGGFDRHWSGFHRLHYVISWRLKTPTTTLRKC